jgi:prophage DNA circulation protein
MNSNSSQTLNSHSLLLVFLFWLLSPSRAQAFLDTIVDSAEKVAEASALVDATHELLKTVENNSSERDSSNKHFSDLDRSISDLSASLDKIEGKTQTAVWAKNEIEALMKAPRLSKMTLTDSIRSSSEYLKRVKRLFLALANFPKASSAYAQTESAFTLQEQLKLQRSSLAVQTEILTELKLQMRKSEIESRSFDELMTQEFIKRRGVHP